MNESAENRKRFLRSKICIRAGKNDGFNDSFCPVFTLTHEAKQPDAALTSMKKFHALSPRNVKLATWDTKWYCHNPVLRLFKKRCLGGMILMVNRPLQQREIESDAFFVLGIHFLSVKSEGSPVFVASIIRHNTQTFLTIYILKFYSEKQFPSTDQETWKAAGSICNRANQKWTNHSYQFIKT